jgi:hypothetical protein
MREGIKWWEATKTTWGSNIRVGKRVGRKMVMGCAKGAKFP